MQYRQKKYRDWYHGAARTESYRGTITDKNDPDFLLMKSDITERNNNRKRHIISTIDRYYVGREEDTIDHVENTLKWRGFERLKICGRGPRRDADGNRLYANVDSHLRHADSTHFDVYVIRNYDAEYNFINWVKKEYCPKIYEQEKIKDEIRMLEYKLLALKQGWTNV